MLVEHLRLLKLRGMFLLVRPCLVFLSEAFVQVACVFPDVYVSGLGFRTC